MWLDIAISQGPNFDTVDNTSHFYRPQVAVTSVHIVNRNGPGCERPPIFVADVRSTTEKMKFSKELRWAIAHFSSNGIMALLCHGFIAIDLHLVTGSRWLCDITHVNNTHKYDGKTIYDTDPEIVNWQKYYK